MSGVQVEADFLKPLPLRELLKVGRDSWRKFYALNRSFPGDILSRLAYERSLASILVTELSTPKTVVIQIYLPIFEREVCRDFSLILMHFHEALRIVSGYQRPESRRMRISFFRINSHDPLTKYFFTDHLKTVYRDDATRLSLC